VASGSGAPRTMVVCPCTMATLANIASGASGNLLERAADVVLKERGNLVLVPRETPYSVIHLENMLKLARVGALILPANPGFYNKPRKVDELVDFIVARVLDQIGIDTELLKRWGRDD
jgi:4-hydroxy-3-polyprenylbenzoate decarboxylase